MRSSRMWCLAAGLSLTCLACGEDEPPLSQPPVVVGDGDGDGDGDTDDAGTEGDTDGDCSACEFEVEACDGVDLDTPFTAMGAGCEDRPVSGEETNGHPEAIGVVDSVGSGIFVPREGLSLAVMGTGRVADLLNPDQDCTGTPALGPEYNQGDTLPAPIQTNKVGDVDCFDDPDLVGMGDCSNTIEDQFNQGVSANDYSELRFSAVVPGEATSVKFDLAFLTTEYPDYVGATFNDMFVGWLESERWTGNVSFDNAGHPISVNAGFLDIKDDNGTSASLQGTCLQGHGATNWLTSTTEVSAGEQVQLVFAIFDMGDSIYDSFVLLDHFRWGCDECGGPSTTPDETGGDETGETGETG